MKTILAGHARSGTMSIAKFLQVFGIDARWQTGPLAGDWAGFYDLDRPRFDIMKFIHIKCDLLHDFESHWAFYGFLHAFQQYMGEDIRILFMTRNPVNSINSMLYYWKNRLKNHSVTLDDCDRKYDEVYSSVARQALKMNPRPRIMKFERFIKGEYTDKLFQMFDIPGTKKNFKLAEEQLERKVNSIGDYEKRVNCQRAKHLHDPIAKCQWMKEIVEELCDEI